MDLHSKNQEQPQNQSHPLTESTSREQAEHQSVSENPQPTPANQSPENVEPSTEGRRVTSRSVWEIYPYELDFDDTAFSILQQLQAKHHLRWRAAERIRVMYDASVHLDREIRRHGERNTWILNFEAAQALCHGFELFPCEAFQLQCLEFNPRLQVPLSEHDLWNVIRAADIAGGPMDRGWLKMPVDQNGPLLPKPPLWFGGRDESQFWIPNPKHLEDWKQMVVRKAPTFPASLIDWILWMRRQREKEAKQGGPPMEDHPIRMGEIGRVVGLSAFDVDDHLSELVGRNLVTSMDFGHVPGIYDSSVLVPNAF